MTTPAPAGPQAVPDFTIDGGDAAFLGDPVLFFTVPGASSARIDAIRMEIDYPSLGINGDLYGLQYVVPGSAIAAQVWTPSFVSDTENDSAEKLFLTWMRDGTGSDQLPSPTYVLLGDIDINGFSTCTLALPDVVVPPLTQVQIIRAHGGDGGSPIVSVTGCTVTYTQDTGPTSLTTPDALIPLLLPQATS